MSAEPGPPRRRGLARARALSGVATLVRLVTGLFALILVLHVVFVVGRANPDNWLAQLVGGWATRLDLGLAGLFAPKDPTLQVVADFGVAAVVWLIIGAIVGRVLRRFG